MANNMGKTKKSYNLTDAESAYFAYKWIAQNIAINYSLGNKDYMEIVYDSGEGSPSGLSNLFQFVIILTLHLNLFEDM